MATIDGTQFNDVRDGGFAADLIRGLRGNDLLRGNDGNDTIYGGTNVFSAADNLLSGSDTIFGGGGNDFIDVSNSWDFDPSTVTNQAYGGTGNDTIVGGGGNDSLYGGTNVFSAADNLLSGSDTIYGHGGNDFIDVSNSWDFDPSTVTNQAYGGTGNDTILGGNGRDTLSGEDGNDSLTGFAGDDSIIGGLGSDTLSGGDGIDTLNGFGTIASTVSQFDTLDGGAGVDFFVLGGNWGISYVEPGDGYAVIQNWDWVNDWIDVRGSGTNASQFSLVTNANVSGGAGLDTQIFYAGDRIGIVQDSTNVSVSRDFRFV